ncbi:hypothetical protein [Methylomagnum sp.]
MFNLARRRYERRKEPGACRLVFAQPCHFALNPLRHNREPNIRAALFGSAINLEKLLSHKGIKPHQAVLNSPALPPPCTPSVIP